MRPAALAIAALCVAGGAVPAAEAPAPPTALERLARQAADAIARAGAEPPVALGIQAGSAELGRAFSTLLAAQLGRSKLPAIPLDAPPERAEEAARTAGARSVARLTIALDGGLVTCRGDVFGLWENFWAGASRARPQSPAAAIAESAVPDAYALALAAAGALAPVSPTGPASSLELASGVLAHVASPLAALAAGDLDGDGRDEVVALTDSEVLAFSPEGRLLARYDHRAALPPSPTPSRDPAGTVAVVQRAPARIAYFSGRHAQGELLELSRGALASVGRLDRPQWPSPERPLRATLRPGQSAYAPELLVGDAAVTLPAPYVTLSAFSAGGALHLLAVGDDGSGMRLAAAAPSQISLEPGLGAGSALVDLDGDGAPEIATSSAAFSPAPEALRVVGPGHKVLWEGNVPAGRILQLVAAELDGDRRPELLAGVWLPDGTAEIQVFRRVSR